MRNVIQINKSTLFFILLIILGSLFFIQGICSIIKSKNAVTFDCIEEERMKEGNYVVGTINSYLTQNLNNQRSGSGTGVSQSVITFGKDYSIYNIAIKNNKYIRIMVADRNIIKSLENMKLDEGSDVYFEGKLIRSPMGINDKWYDLAGISSEDIISNFVIKEISIKNEVKKLFFGICLFLLSIEQFFLMGGVTQLIKDE